MTMRIEPVTIFVAVWIMALVLVVYFADTPETVLQESVTQETTK